MDQKALATTLAKMWGTEPEAAGRFTRIQRGAGVEGRHLALPLDAYRELRSLAQSNDAWLRVAPELAIGAIAEALARAGLTADQVDQIWFTTVTGVAAPSLEGRIAERIGLRRDVRRTPLFGLGCAGGAAALGQAAEMLRSMPDGVALVLSVELCSLTLQQNDHSPANMVASALFGDGAAAVVLLGAGRAAPRGPRALGSRSVIFPDSVQMLGWELVETGFKIVLAPGLLRLIEANLCNEIDEFLSAHGLRRNAITQWIVHPGGPKVLDAVEKSLELDATALARSRQLLRRCGNLSSASVLVLLEEALHEECAGYGLMLAMGPGFALEMVLLGW